MNVRTKMLSLVALLFAVLSVLELSIQKQVLMPSFAQLERDEARTSMKRIDYALNTALGRLGFSAVDWGNWADMYQYLQTPTAEFEDKYINALELKQLQVNMVMIVDLKGNLVVAGSWDLDSGAPLNLNLAVDRTLPENFPWRRNLAAGTPARGLIRTNRGIMMVAAGPLLDGRGAGPSLGMVIMGKLLTSTQLRLIGAQAQANLAMLAPEEGPYDPGAQLVETESTTQVFQSFVDIYGRPVMKFRVDVPRKITARGMHAVNYASAYFIGAAITVLMSLVIVLNRVVLAPLARLTRHAVSIGEGTDLTQRLNFPGRDEVARLAREFDRMVDRVAESRRQLVDQSFQAGFAELATGVLHNLGNAMTPLGVRLSTLSDRLVAAPAADVEAALIELADDNTAPDRRRDLEKFVRLACRELALGVRQAQADVAVIQRQASVVQSALCELMRSTRSAPVVEPVRLPELVAQTLEIVPDACRQRLMVDSDESLRKVGVVRVARTVLRMILQNLIINAADAVRDAGREKGVLHVAAQIVQAADCEELHLQCKDDGVGISAENLARVFEHGFSTKSRETHHGIGLHWCANAIAALGGRIWASSDGLGLGASMHLMLPLAARANPAIP